MSILSEHWPNIDNNIPTETKPHADGEETLKQQKAIAKAFMPAWEQEKEYRAIVTGTYEF